MEPQMSREIYRERINQFPRQIVDLSNDNPIIHTVLQAFAHGAIITKEEALYRMVIELARTSDSYKNDLIKQVQMMAIKGFPLTEPGPYQPPP